MCCAALPSRDSFASQVTESGVPLCGSSHAYTFAFASYGSIYLSSGKGTGSCRLTSPLAGKEPRRAPDGRRVAFLSGVGTGGDGTGAENSVHVLTVGENGHRSLDTVLHTNERLHGKLLWSPDSHALAFLDGPNLWLWRVSCGCSSQAMGGSSAVPVRSFDWSPDSRRLAVYRASSSEFPIARIPVSILDVRTRTISTVLVRFPPNIGNPRTGAGSYPSQLIGWTSNNHVLLGTSGWGIGVALTGIWSALATGGPARLMVGGRSHGYGVSGPVLLNADAALLSPDGRRLLIDSNTRFWVGSEDGRFIRWLSPRLGRSCGLTQFSWVSNTVVNFVTVCTTGTPRLFFSLSTLSTSGGGLERIATAHSHDRAGLSIAPPVRCFCGAG